MGKTWVAVVFVALMVVTAAGWVFFATVGRGMLGDRLAEWAADAGSVGTPLLYRAALAVNPHDNTSRLALAELYRSQGDLPRAEHLLREGIDRYNTGPDLYLALAVMYVEDGRLEEACGLLDSVPSGYLSRRVASLRPDNAAAPPSGTYAAGIAFPLAAEENPVWYRLNEGAWTLYGGPLELTAGKHTLRVLTLDEHSIPSRVEEYRYTVETLAQTAVTYHFVTCPFCGEMWPEKD